MNILLLMMDALRPDHLGFAGYDRPTSPNLDRFQDEAVWFRNAYTPSPSTRFAMASMFTGSDVRSLPHRRMGANRFQLDRGATTVAERLRASGYRTVGHTISYVMHHIRGIGQGFEEWGTPWPVDEWSSIFGRAGQITTDAAIESLRSFPETGDARFFLYAHYRCTHDPYIAHEAWDFGSRPLDRYDSALAYCDEQLARLFAAVDARADRERTAVFIVSDHGELFGEQGFHHHGHTLSEPDVRIAMLMRVPGVEPAVVDAPVLLTDIAPTLLDLAHLDFSDEAEGWSLLPYALGEVPEDIGRQLFLFTDLQRGNVRFRAEATIRWPEKEIRDLRLNTVEVESLSAEDFYSRR